jgi:hypothetical protein
MTTDKALPILELNVSEENEIGFKLRIEGSDKDIGSSKPNVRFVVTETSSGKGWIFSATKTDDGVAINVPVMKGIVTENNKYNGKLEVILGGRYFTPTEVDIEFVEPLKVEAAVVSSVSVKKKSDNSTFLLEESKSVSEDLQDLSIESEIDSIIVKDSSVKESVKKIQPSQIAKEVVKEHITPVPQVKPVLSKKSNYSELSSDEKEAVNNLFLEKCSKYNMDAKEVKRLIKEGTSYTKKRLSALLAISMKEYFNS